MSPAAPDLSRYLNIRYAHAGSFTADGSRVVFVSNITGIPQAWAMPAGGGWPEQLTFGEDRVADLHASASDPDVLVFGRDDGGNERIQLHAVRPDGSAERPLVTDAEAIHRFGDFGPDGTWFTFASNRRNGVDFDLYRADLATGEARLIAELEGWIHPGPVSPDGERCLITRLYSGAHADVLLVDLASGSGEDLTSFDRPAFHHSPEFGAGAVFLAGDRDGEFQRAYRLDLESRRFEAFGPERWDVEHLAVRGSQGALVVNDEGRSRLYLFDPAAVEMKGEVPLPLGVVGGVFFSRDASRLLVTFTGALHNLDLWEVDPERLAVERVTFSSTGGVDPASFVEPELARLESFDGLSVPMWIYRPRDVERPPVVVSVHGGPEGQARPHFNSIHQYFVARGYAVVAPNVRGSRGYGRSYMALDDVRKRPDSVKDLAAVARWVKDQDDLDGDRLAVMGGSYGGFMVLATLTTDPDLWTAGIDIVGIANLVTFLENTGAYRRKVREPEYGNLENDREFLTELSPINSVERITAPLLVIHGANDPRVPLCEAEQIHAELTKLGRPVRLLVFDDEGHGIIKLANRKVAYGAVADFLDEHL